MGLIKKDVSGPTADFRLENFILFPTAPPPNHESPITLPLTSHFSRPRQRPSGAPPGSLPFTALKRRSWTAFDNGGLQNFARLEGGTRQRI